MNIKNIESLMDILKEVTIPVAVFIILVVGAIYIYKLLNTDGPLNQMIFKPKNPKWDTTIELKEGDKLHQLIDDAKRQEVFKKLSGITTDVSKIDSLIALENSSTKINYRIIRNAMPLIEIKNDIITVDITKRVHMLDILTKVIFFIPFVLFLLLSLVLLIELIFNDPKNLTLVIGMLFTFMAAILTAIFSGFLRRPYLSAKRIREVMSAK
ncbi:hypothetical protein [Sphingobacterium sp. UDSM-2020]|uniref:hypothetical protein n=1 Tax=Sphingobacterium sp. UDSM-2020 TaxID=2795738 RepID=UPI0019352171|nr:hypothetical protein [Sphingobacterium sp. UDSM-2020]QQD13389.1 hypothetical protein JAZ75_22820 [Sphingobacterium sp. UDSM-2020]